MINFSKKFPLKSFSLSNPFTKLNTLLKLKYNTFSQGRKYPLDNYHDNDSITGLLIPLNEKPGALSEVLNIFSKTNVNLTYINSRPGKFTNSQKQRLIEFYIDRR